MLVRNWRNNLQRWRCKIETMLLRIVCIVTTFCTILYSPFMAYASVDVATPFNADLSSDVDTLDSDFLVFDDSGVSAHAESTLNYNLQCLAGITSSATLGDFGRFYIDSSGNRIFGQPAQNTVIKQFGVYSSLTGSVKGTIYLSVPYQVAESLGKTLYFWYRPTSSSSYQFYSLQLTDRWRKYTSTSTGGHYTGDYVIPVVLWSNGSWSSNDNFRAYLGDGSKSMTYTASSDNVSGYTFKIYSSLAQCTYGFGSSYGVDMSYMNGTPCRYAVPLVGTVNLPDWTTFRYDVENTIPADTPCSFSFYCSNEIDNISLFDSSFSNMYTSDSFTKNGNYYTVVASFPETLRLGDLGFSCRITGSGWHLVTAYLSNYKVLSDSDVTNSKIDNISSSVTNISNSITNISNKITNSTTTITNAISNVTTTITNAVNKAADTITGNADKNSQNEINSANQNSQKEIDSAKQNSQNEINAAKKNADAIQKNLDDNTGKVNEKLEDVKKGIIAGIIDGLKSLFIPSDDFFKSYFDDLYQWFSDRLGFLMFPIDLILQLVDVFISSSSVDCVLTLPSFSIMDEQLWQEQTFNFTSFLNEHFSMLVTAIRLVSSIGLIIAFVNYCERKWEEVMGN